MKQPTHRCDSLCKVECDPTTPGLGSVMTQHGSNRVPKGEKHPPQRIAPPMRTAPNKTEQPQ